MAERRPPRCRRRRGADLGRLQLAAGVVALPQAPPGRGERAGAARPLRGRAVSRVLQHPGSRGDRRAAGVHPGPARAALRRRRVRALGARAWSASATPSPSGWSGVWTRRAEIPVRLLRRGLSVSPARSRPDAHPSPGRGRAGRRASGVHLLGTDRLGRDQWSRLAHGTRTSMTIGLTAVTLSVVFGVLLGGISGYVGGLARPRHPAGDRAAAVAADDPDLAGAHRGAAARLVAPAGLLRDHRDPVAGGLDDARARGARAVPGAPRGGLRAGRRAGGGQPPPDHRPPHGAELPEPHHRHQHAGHPGDDHQRDGAVVPGPRDPAARDLLGRAPAGGAEHPDAGAGALAARPRRSW